jgi:DNA-binding response OmpR family regulator
VGQAPAPDLKVLLVEDDPTTAAFLKYTLAHAQAPWRLEHVDSLEGALRRLASSAGDEAILLDLSLPDSKGEETIVRVRQSAPTVPIVVLTGTSREEDIPRGVQALQAGADDYLVKSDHLTASAVVRAVTHALQRRRAQAEREQLIAELQRALDKVKALTGLLPMCSSCRRIKGDDGAWDPLEHYLSKHSSTQVSHGICPDCAAKLYPDYTRRKPRDQPND